MGWAGARGIAGALVVLAGVLAACISAPQPTPTPTSSATPSPSPTPVVRRICPQQQQLSGAITGRLAYPSDVLPALAIYAMRVEGGSYRLLHTAPVARPQSPTYTMLGVEPGTYIVIAYAVDERGAARSDGPAGAYTPAISCGLGPNCTNHTPIRVTVKGGETMRNVDLLDWYAPAGTFPPPPTGADPYAAGERVAVCNPFADEVNLRATAGTSGALMGTVPNGTEVAIIDGPQPANGYDWYAVRLPTMGGWVVGYALRR
jgi:hypothetical protein